MPQFLLEGNRKMTGAGGLPLDVSGAAPSRRGTSSINRVQILDGRRRIRSGDRHAHPTAEAKLQYRQEDAMNIRTGSTLGLLALVLSLNGRAADIPGSKDPAGVQRYTGSEIIGYHAGKFDEFLLPLGPPTQLAPPAYAKSLKTEGLISRYTYLAPAGRSPAELFRNYQLEF